MFKEMSRHFINRPLEAGAAAGTNRLKIAGFRIIIFFFFFLRRVGGCAVGFQSGCGTKFC